LLNKQIQPVAIAIKYRDWKTDDKLVDRQIQARRNEAGLGPKEQSSDKWRRGRGRQKDK
jgi:hypothetical protein